MIAVRPEHAIAVIGLSCRLPGAATPQAFWELLHGGRDAITETPRTRLGELADVPSGLRRGGFLEGVDQFDAAFFGISPREAIAMDPQQRLTLELCWEALEDAGIAPSASDARGAGIYVGAIAADYAELALAAGAEGVALQAFTGTQRSIIANRVSYTLGLRGPSITIDTGQSSSLVAVHLACESLRSGESPIAIAGGVHLNLGLNRALTLDRAGVLSDDGKCFAFDFRANGFVRGEGGAFVVLKPLASALADEDPIHCIIRGSAVNNDGGGDGLTVPSASAQARMLRAAHDAAGVVAADIGYIELHGTGTPVGDRVEATALGSVFSGRPRPVAVGSAKTNIGHLEAAAGVAGLIKLALALKHAELPASLNFERPRLDVNLNALGLRVQTERGPWPEGVRLAGVSSFGIGGTNCHLIVEQAPERPPRDLDEPSGPAPLILSAKTSPALRAYARRLAEAQATGVHAARSLVTTRSAFEHRAVVINGTLEGLEDVVEGRPSDRVVAGFVDPDLQADRPTFVFPGQGGQWDGMTVALLDGSTVFSNAMRACEEALSPLVDFSVEGVLRGSDGQPSLAPIEVVQPVLFAIMVSLAAVWRDAGVEPAAVLGHSQGEIAAAHIVGGLSLEDAARIVVVRSNALAKIEGRGGMLAASLSVEQYEERAAAFAGRVGIAAINGPTSLVLSGDQGALDAIAAGCEADDIRTRPINSTVPGHSHHIDELRNEIIEGLRGITPQASEIPLYSTVTGERIATETMDAEHWFSNVRQTVRFAPTVERALRAGSRTFLEIGPHPVLTVPIEATVAHALGTDQPAIALSTLRRDRGGPERFTAALAELWTVGGTVDWASQIPVGSRVRLPTYPFQRRRYWLSVDPTAVPETVSIVGGVESSATDDADATDDATFTARIRAMRGTERDHAVLEAVVEQAAAVLGHGTPDEIDRRRTFKELGFDSPGLVDLGKRITTLTGLRLTAATLFDHPSPTALAAHVASTLVRTTHSVTNARHRAPAKTDEPIAIVAMACRYPGDADTPEALWDLVATQADAIGPFPTDRGWNLDELFDPDGERTGTTYVDRGGFLAEAAAFDAALFGISPREALAMDPQQRLLLECSWEALERGGIDPHGLRGSLTGVFTGIISQDYGPQLHLHDERSAGYALTGNESSVASGRVSYALGLEGPAVSIDTACSSSLVAIHLACQALRSGECDLALAGGVSVMAQPGIFVEFSRQRGLSPDGRCRAFGAGANGTGWGEGVGVLLLQPLSAALESGRAVLAVIRGSAVNQDGASNGLTAPSGRSQERVIAAALANAGLSAQDIDAVEAHGTGTALGDPIEATALLAAYGQNRETPLRLGSLKSNIGHTQAAAGVGGVIKMVQALRHELLPATLYAEDPSPQVDWESGRVALLSEPQAWPVGERVRRAGISSFGVSGTNAHVIIEQPPAAELASPRGTSGPLPFVLSGASARALVDQTAALAEFLAQDPEHDPVGVAALLARGRAQLAHRTVVVTDDLVSLSTVLLAVADGRSTPDAIQGVAKTDRRTAFVFPGQGGQWERMAVELLDQSPAFAENLSGCQNALAAHVDWVLEDVLRGTPGAPSLDRVDVVQPALWAVMVSLARLWEAHGVRPAGVIGHSQGEIAAAHIAGALSLEDAALIVAGRSSVLAGTLSGHGGMVAVGTSAEAIQTYLQPFDGRVSLAAVNSASSVVVSGDSDALVTLIDRCENDNIRAKRLPVDYAAHSAQIETVRDRLLEQFASLQPRAGDVPLYSTVTGKRIEGTDLGAEYWFENLRQTVLYDSAVGALADDGFDAVVELGPHPVLIGQTLETFERAGRGPDAVTAIGSLRRDDGGLHRFTTSLAEAFVAGLPVTWTLPEPTTLGTALPTYAFQRERFWLSPTTGHPGDPSALGQISVDHPILHAEILQPDGGTRYTGRLSIDDQPWVADHAVLGTVLFPGAGFVDLALYAASRTDTERVDDLTLHAPLTLQADSSVAVHVSVGAPERDGCRSVEIYSHADDPQTWTQHAAGTLGPARGLDAGLPPHVVGGEDIGGDDLYERLADAGYEYGPAFQGLRLVERTGNDVYAEVTLPEDLSAEGFAIHPSFLDAILQARAAGNLSGNEIPVPFSFSGVQLHAANAVRGQASLRTTDGGPQIVVDDETGSPILTVDEFSFRPFDRSQLQAAGAATRTDGLYQVQWEPQAGTADGPTPRIAIIGKGPAPDEAEAERYADLPALEAALAVDAGATPDVVFVHAPTSLGDDRITAVHGAAEAALSQLQAWLASAPLTSARLVLITTHAVTCEAGDRPDLGQAAILGLVRSAHSEHPGRFALLDGAPGDVPLSKVLTALAADEPVLAIRSGELLVPRLREADVATARPVSRVADPDGTILITGGTGGLGALLARHLADNHEARHLLLVSRSGPAAAGASDLVDTLQQAGCEATVVACDVSDRGEVEQLLGAIPAAHPLTAVIHAAGALDDAMLTSMDAERLHRVLRPKVDAAVHLDELTRELDLAEFIFYSSAAATLGLPGQSNYAAANAALDALAHDRHAEGLPGTSLAFGMWETATGMTSHVTGERAQRNGPAGTVAISDRQGLELIDAARTRATPLLAPLLLDEPALRAQARSGYVAPIFRRLFATNARSTAPVARSFAGRVASVPHAERDAIALSLVLERLAAVLGHETATTLDPQRPFKELGIDSLTGVELRNQLARESGLTLPATLVFDHPTPAAVASLLLSLTDGSSTTAGRQRVRRAATDEPLAIVGMACRFPGGADSPDALWDLVASGTDAVGPFPENRGWDVKRLFDPDPEHLDTTYTRHGGFVHEADLFDATHFGISPREAVAMDPQQRMLLECAWEAIEHAGIDPASLRGSLTGVYAGAFDSGYAVGNHAAEVQGLRGTGAITSAVSGRISYQLGLVGPAVSVDTACSSSLVALHLACQALRANECDLAISGGVTILASPWWLVDMSRQRALSPDGRCQAFGAGGNGTGLSDGAGMVVLERLSSARERGRNVLAVIRGSAVNQDGASNGFTAPSGPSQERVIRAALANAGLAASDIDAIEAHGTGTPLGDPIEAQALIATYGRERHAGPLRLGSLKSNVGHAQAAAGVGGVIKMVQALQHEVLPQTLWVDEPSPHVSWENSGVELLATAQPWPTTDRPRRAGVSSFGISGTNAHLLLEEAPAPPDPPLAAEIPSRILPFLVSGSTNAGLRSQASRLSALATTHPTLEPSAVAAALAGGRAHLPHRAVVVAGTIDELANHLRALSRGEFVDAVAQGVAQGQRRAAFVFPGQGGQWEGMAVELLDQSPVFAERMLACEKALAPFVDFSLLGVLRGDPGEPSLDPIEVVQPALFAIMVSLAALWQSFGIVPAAVVGHSQGEIAAAHIVGGLTLDDAARIIAVRSQALAKLAGSGGMLAVGLSTDQFHERSKPFDERITIAAINGPRSLVVSGDPAVLDAFAAGCDEDNIQARRILSTVPGHSPPVEAVRDEMLAGLADLAPQPSTTPLYSTVTGQRLQTETMDAEHWYRNLRQTVQFAPAVEALTAEGIGALIEVGPHPVLTSHIQDTIEAAGIDADAMPIVSTVRRADGGLERYIRSLADAYVAGLSVNWERLFGERRPHVPLPTYAFQRDRYWLNPMVDAYEPTAAGQRVSDHPLLDAAIALAAGDGVVFTGRISLERYPWLGDHAVGGTILVPAGGILDLALHSARHVGAPVIEALTLTAPLTLAAEQAVTLQVGVSPPDTDGRRVLKIHAQADDQDVWTEHATGTIHAESTPPAQVEVAASQSAPAIESDDFYARLDAVGIECHATAQGVRRVIGPDSALRIELEPSDGQAPARLATMLDAALQPASLVCSEHANATLLTYTCRNVHVDALDRARSVAVTVDPVAATADIVFADAHNTSLGSLQVELTQPDVRPPAGAPAGGLLRVAWEEYSPPEPRGARFIVLGSGDDFASDLESHPDLDSVRVALNDGDETAALVLADFRAPLGGRSPLETPTVLLIRGLKLLQAWLADDDLAERQLVLVTRGAVAAGDEAPSDIAGAALWGLVRCAQSENPGRFVLLDVEDDGLVPAAMAALTGEQPQCAARGGIALVPRLTPVTAPSDAAPLTGLATGTVLVTGGTSGVGAVLARHLVAEHGARNVLLASRSGPEAAGAREIKDALTALGATVEIAACDVAERSQVAKLLESIPDTRPLLGVVHAAGAFDNAMVASMTPRQIEVGLAAKADGARHLDELTRDVDLGFFVLCSSMAATFGGPGQGNYAAANMVLDALSEQRHALGLPTTSIQWGLWDDVGQSSSFDGPLDQYIQRATGSAAFEPFVASVGCAMFDGCVASRLPALIASPYRMHVVRRETQLGTAPVLLETLGGARPRRAAVGGPGAHDLAEVTRAQITSALGYESPDKLPMELSFLELGFDSLVSLDLRRRLKAVTGFTLPATVLFDHATPAALIAHLQNLAGEESPAAKPPATSDGNGNGTSGTLVGLFERAVRIGKLQDGLAVAHATGALRPRFGLSHTEGQTPTIVELARGDHGPILVCIPSLVATSGPHEYARLAKHIPGTRAVVVVPAPGFSADELLPSRFEAAVEAQAIAITRYAADRPVALVGFSTGGLLSYAVADALTQRGLRPSSLTLIDSYTADSMWPIADAVVARMLDGGGEHPAVDDERLTAMGTYIEFLRRWVPRPPVAPTLLLKAIDRVPGTLADGDWTASWTLCNARINVPGTHLTILDEHAATTADAVEAWVARHPNTPGRRRTLRTRLSQLTTFRPELGE